MSLRSYQARLHGLHPQVRTHDSPCPPQQPDPEDFSLVPRLLCNIQAVTLLSANISKGSTSNPSTHFLLKGILKRTRVQFSRQGGTGLILRTLDCRVEDQLCGYDQRQSWARLEEEKETFIRVFILFINNNVNLIITLELYHKKIQGRQSWRYGLLLT